MIKNNITPDFVAILKSNEYFVFGSNRQGIHGAGGAKFAKEKFGAKVGIGEGITGQTYALPTVDFSQGYALPLSEIAIHVNKFINFAKENVDKTFLVTEIGCGLVGYSVDEIAPLFKEAINQLNIHLPKRFIKVLNYLQN